MKKTEHLAVIGSGPSAIYLLKHLLDHSKELGGSLREISIFEEQPVTGMGMPYSPETTDRYNMSNISSEELPELKMSFGDWLRSQDAQVLASLDLEGVEIDDSEVYPRLALGQYFQAQYRVILAELREQGVTLHEHASCEIVDIKDDAEHGTVTLATKRGEEGPFDKVIIATGHAWSREDRPEKGYYASPWPMFKLLPRKGEVHNFAIGTLGASLSAFDVLSSLAHRHGDFVDERGKLVFKPYPNTEQFKIVLHAADGLLPHLQFDQSEPMREIYRHTDREGLLALVDDDGRLRLETYFDKICRPALRAAFQKDDLPQMVKRLDSPSFGLEEFVEGMTDQHEYANPFEGMREEMVEAKASVENHCPIHWKEVTDDLMYTLNFHAELMPTEDHLFLQSKVMPFLLNVVAAMPLQSGDTILALYDAGKLEMVPGRVTVVDDEEENDAEEGGTTVEVDDEGSVSTCSYRMFIDCSGQKGLELSDFPFPSLVASETVRNARAKFAVPGTAKTSVPESKKEQLLQENGEWLYLTGGVEVNAAYQLVGRDGEPSARIFDVAFPHTSGIRPYSYGLQACSDTCEILVRSWVAGLNPDSPGPEEATKLYEKV